MEVMLRTLLALLFSALIFCYISVVEVSATTIALYNKCSHPVWPGIQPSAGKPILARGGFKLNPNQAYSLKIPAGWSGRIWGRQDCYFDGSGRGHCATGDCGGALYCNGVGGAPPATLAEITLGEQDFYDVSLVDGYNLAISITPFRGKGKCSYAGCVSDLNLMCPVGLQVRSHDNRRVVACKSACFAFQSPKYCCTGTYGNPQSCKPTAYSRIFKTACPKAYSYAYDDPTSIATCSGGSYLVTFCPHR
ncbi:PREDICTED: thaumatin-like protein isoform X1 [Nelumbo nucifera]|uniref:Thaumatin-like protein isoform X1 n=1 Tax=Nelumbo nucifera TaxID=4432 RepID=A0A1U8AJN1_NELNU|nr:PREDICTED: thaumatin-like protein isoform X1 [Nelumbo nucifera]